MRIIDIINLCRQSLSKQKARTRLTVLGVVIGCCAIVLMLSLGIGSSERTKIMLSNMGDLSIINVWNYSGGGGNNPIKSDTLVSMRAIPDVELVTPKHRINSADISITAGIKDRYKCSYASLVGVTENAPEKLGYKIKEGDYWEGTGVGFGKRAIPVLVGERFFYEFNDTKRPEGKNSRRFDDPAKFQNGYYDGPVSTDSEEEVKPYEEPYFSSLDTKLYLTITTYGDNGESKEYRQELKIAGVLKADMSKDYNTMQGIYISVADMESIAKKVTPKSRQKELGIYNEVIVKANDMKNVKEIETQIKAMGYEPSSMESIRESINKSTRQEQMMLAGLGSISLFVAAIGIMNTMIMSITERTKEIGIMKALGCYVNDVRKIFLVEAGAIGFIGGVIGVISSLIISLLINVAGILGLVNSPGGAGKYGEIENSAGFLEKLANVNIDFAEIYKGLTTAGSRTSIIPIWLILFGLLFSTLVGLVSGYHPANKAVKIPALEAIKHE